MKPASSAPTLIQYLVTEMRWCKSEGISFNAVVQEARKQFAREQRERALKEQP